MHPIRWIDITREIFGSCMLFLQVGGEEKQEQLPQCSLVLYVKSSKKGIVFHCPIFWLGVFEFLPFLSHNE